MQGLCDRVRIAGAIRLVGAHQIKALRRVALRPFCLSA